MREERWAPVPGYESRYEVSDAGRVKSVARKVWNSRGFWQNRSERLLTPTPGSGGGLMVKLYDGEGGNQTIKVAVLVLNAFVGPRPDGTECCHTDDDMHNNALDNLRWDTRSSNIRDQVRNGNHNMARKTHCVQGHPLSGDNLVRYRNQRCCKTCREVWRARTQQRKALKHVDS